MHQSPLRLIKSKVEFLPVGKVKSLPSGLRGIYVLYNKPNRKVSTFDVVYVGMARAGKGRGLKRRLISHTRSMTKRGLWTHFSVFEVWDNIRDEEVEELEGLFRHIYRHDAQANRLNVLRRFKKLGQVPRLQ